MADEPTDEAPSADEGTSAVAVVDEAPVEPAAPAEPPAIEMGPAVDPMAEARKTRLWLPFLLPIGAILVVAFVTFNVSRVFLAASENSHTPAVLIASGITLAILIGASVIAAFPDIRTSSLVIGMCGVMVVVLLAGSLVLGASEPHEEEAAGFVEPAGPAINTLEVDALPTLKFQASSFDVPGGINEIRYVDKGGTHTLVFADNAVPGFKLAVPNGLNRSKVELGPDKEYTIYCDIPGHRQAGMEATLTAGPAPADPAPEPGTETPPTTLAPEGGQTPAPDPAPNEDPASQSSTGGT